MIKIEFLSFNVIFVAYKRVRKLALVIVHRNEN